MFRSFATTSTIVWLCLVVKSTPANQRQPFSIFPSSISTCDQKLFGVMLRPTLISNPLLRAVRRPNIFALISRYPKWWGPYISNHIHCYHCSNVPAAQAFADAARLSSSDVSWKRDAPPAADAEEHAGKTAVNEANQSQNLCIWLCSFFRGKSTGAGGLTVQFICFFLWFLCHLQRQQWPSSTMANSSFN